MKHFFSLVFSNPLLRFILIFCVASLGITYFNHRIYGDVASSAAWERAGYALVPTTMLTWVLHAKHNVTIGRQIKRVGLWLGFLLFFLLLYSFRAELGWVKARIVAAVMPQTGFESRPGSMSFYRSSDGHFYVEARVTGQSVRFLVDTGASDIVIAPHTARSLGFDRRDLQFTRVYETANGKGRGAAVFLDTFQVGALTLRNVPASVNDAAMRESLLGMRFFNRLQGFQMQQEILTIHWRQERQER